jgi:hypothetical protein
MNWRHNNVLIKINVFEHETVLYMYFPLFIDT